MAVSVRVTTPVDVARMVEGLLLAAETAQGRGCPLLAAAFTELADQVGDALDGMPTTSIARLRAEQARSHIARYLADGERLNGIRREPR